MLRGNGRAVAAVVNRLGPGLGQDGWAALARRDIRPGRDRQPHEQQSANQPFSEHQIILP